MVLRFLSGLLEVKEMALCLGETPNYPAEVTIILERTATTTGDVIGVVVHVITDCFAQGFCEIH
jgi:hypothetical protein